MKKEYKTVPITDIKPYPNNPRLNDDAVDAVKKSISQCGYIAPIVTDENLIVLAGHTRLKALTELKRQTVDIMVVSGLTDEQKRKYRLLDNKTNELSDWNFNKLVEEMDGLDFGDLDLDWGLTDEQPEEGEAVDDKYEPIPPVTPKSQHGEIYQLGEHRLMCGDATKREDVEKLMDGQLADLVITDPPYNVNYGEHLDRLKNYRPENSTRGYSYINSDEMNHNDFYNFMVSAFTNLYDFMNSGASIYCFHADFIGELFREAFKESGLYLSQCLIWVKNHFSLGDWDYQAKHEPILYGWKQGAAHYFIDDRTQTDVFEDQIDFQKMKKDELVKYLEDLYENLYDRTTVIHANKPQRSDLHPTMKPIELLGKLMKNSSKPGWTVLDLFGGSGSTLITAEQLGRKCYMMELEPRYVDVIIDRWELLTGEKAVKLNGADGKTAD